MEPKRLLQDIKSQKNCCKNQQQQCKQDCKMTCTYDLFCCKFTKECSPQECCEEQCCFENQDQKEKCCEISCDCGSQCCQYQEGGGNNQCCSYVKEKQQEVDRCCFC